jgi:hypothetical protein
MPKPLRKLNWLPDFDGRQRLYRPLNKGRQEIRVVEVLDDDDRSAPLRCVLRTISIRSGDSHRYNALSYYWGSTLDLETVTVYRMASSSTTIISPYKLAASEAFFVPVTKTLAGALRQFRASHQAADGPLILWTDAICINQLDPTERGHQVAIMRKIYIAATSVWIWLGESDARAERGLVDTFAIAQHHRCEAFSDKDHNMSPDLALVGRAMDGVPDPTQAVELQSLVRSVGALASLPYWYRGWTMQEATASGNVRLQYGLTYCYVFSWHKLCVCLDDLFYPLIFHLRHVESLEASLAHLYSWTSTQLCYATSEPSKGEDMTDMGLRSHPNAPEQVAFSLTIFSRSNHWQTADQRDRLYALAGAMSGFAALDLTPNYKTSVENLFEEATMKLLHVGQSWSHLQFMLPSASPFLPSWVVDFTRCINKENFARVNLLYRNFGHWTASRSSKIRVRRDRLGRSGVLHAAGFFCDEIIAVSRYNPHKSEGVVARSADAGLDLWLEYRQYVHEKSRYFPEDVDDIFHRAWCGSLVDDDAFGPQDLAAVQDESNELHEPVWQTINTQFKHQRFVITRDGYIGLAPDSTSVGDRVAILASGSMPFILRKVDTALVRRDAYILIGGCYVDGKSVRTQIR